MKSEHKTILKRDGDVGLLEINNPPQNYLKQPEFVEIDKLKEFIGTGIKALVINGSGRHFSAGADIESIKEQIKDVNAFQEQMENGNRLLNYIDDLEIPVFAAISGVCFGAGLEIALACDIRICDESTLFAFPEVNHDLFPGLGGVRRLKELTGKSFAIELLLEGDMINAKKASELQIVDKVVEKKQTLDHSIFLAKKITNSRSLNVINAVMISISNSERMDIDEVVKNDVEMFSKLALESLAETKISK